MCAGGSSRQRKGRTSRGLKRFTRFLASFSNERFASEDMTAFSGQRLREDAWWHQEVGHGRYQARHHERIQRIGHHQRVQDPTINLQHPQSIFVHQDSPLSKLQLDDVCAGHGSRRHDPHCKTRAQLRSAEYSERTPGPGCRRFGQRGAFFHDKATTPARRVTLHPRLRKLIASFEISTL